ncbi:CbiQ family ECF transporter T component [Texcoconibacillus texcoconensis]|uniref:Energy-coupling factor transporter transmembrane protein EcfT n=1 Tax=Texcoconibacillus texcoconensis TaxID=1095777 RepID=A0A840QQY4_9BACI|nr:energy-coupling factor transport system permease protein [Texcoconibacillus texcoconensis]
MNKLILGRYFPGDSWLHRLDPRSKLIAGVAFIFIIFLADSLQAFALLWVFTLFVMRLSGVGFRTYVRGVRPLIWLILFATLMQMLFRTGGATFVDWGPITISEYGIINGFYVFCRFVLIIFFSTVVTLTTKPIDLTDGIGSLLRPLRKLKVPVDELALMLSISLRFIPNLMDETQRIMDAQRARGTQFGEGSLIQQMKTLVPIFLPLFASSLNRAEDMANAMEVRGYQSGTKRSTFRQLSWKRIDTASLFIMVVLAGVLLVVRTI